MSFKTGARFAEDDGDNTRNNVVMYQQFMQHQHELRQPLPKDVMGRHRTFRLRIEADARLTHEYFDHDCLYCPKKNHCQFGMYRPLFIHILSGVCEVEPTILQSADASGILGHSPHMKMIASMKMFHKGCSANNIDDYCAMGASTIYKYFEMFLNALLCAFNARCLRVATEDDIKRLLNENAARGFPGMLGSIDCMHWRWRQCPIYATGNHYPGHHKAATVILEAVASYDRWFWHGYFGKPGSNNDINVFNGSNVFDKITSGISPTCNYVVNGSRYNHGYFLADGIYLKYIVLVVAFKESSRNPKKTMFNSYQEAKRKDVERAFGTLKSKFQIVDKPCTFNRKSMMKYIIGGCMVMHNMVVENEYRAEDWGLNTEERMQLPVEYNVLRIQNLHDQRAWERLRRDLVEHIWDRHYRRAEDDGGVELDPKDNPRYMMTCQRMWMSIVKWSLMAPQKKKSLRTAWTGKKDSMLTEIEVCKRVKDLILKDVLMFCCMFIILFL